MPLQRIPYNGIGHSFADESLLLALPGHRLHPVGIAACFSHFFPMKLPLVVLASLAGALSVSAAPAPITSTAALYPKDAKSSIESFDPAFASLIAADAVIENLGSGFRWSEGPVWDPAQSALLFSDVPENRVYRWKDG